MEIISIGDKEITIKELNIEQVRLVNLEIAIEIEAIIDAYQQWCESTFDLMIAHPKLFIKLLSFSTGEKKKYLKSLKAKEFDTLAYVFLSVNAEFFIQRLKLLQMSQ